MRRWILPILLTVAAAMSASASASATPTEPLNAPRLADTLNDKADYRWFLDARFGMFIHFGLYSSIGRHSEWVMNGEELSPEAYRKYFDGFKPDLFDARAWMRAAKAAGMKYVVLTVKHHEGFVLFDSQLTDYKITNTPFHRDLVREYVDAARAEGLKVGFYYSLVDWHHPEFPIDGHHPMRNNEAYKQAAAGRDIRKYAAYLRGQVRELLTGYGPIDYLYFDFSYAQKDWGWSKGKGAADWQADELVKMIHQLQPKILLNNRLGIDGGGVITPEKAQFASDAPTDTFKLIEECNTLARSWGYVRDDHDWKSPEQLIHLLVDAVSHGNNLLLNVGPDGRGVFPPEATDRLAAFGDWMRVNSSAIYGAGRSAFAAPDGVRYTQNGKYLYAHFYTWPIESIELPGLAGKVRTARLFDDGAEVRFKGPEAKDPKDNLSTGVSEGAIRLLLPTAKPPSLVPVVELTLE